MTWSTQGRRSITMVTGISAAKSRVRLDTYRLICHGWGKRGARPARRSCGTGAWINVLFRWTRPRAA